MSELSRRDILAGSSGLALGHFFGRDPQEVKPVRWAVLGLGGYARNQIMPNFEHCKHSKLVAVISGSADKAKGVAAKYGLPDSKIYSYDNLEKIKNDEEIDVVYVITPPGTHHEFTLRSLAAGKHVVCEKPMASYAKDAQEMVDAAKKAKKRLGIGYRCHFDAYNVESMRLCRTGALGTLRTIRSDHGFTMNDMNSWHWKRPLGGFGAISEIGIYAIQALCYLAGADPIEVYGTRDKLDVPRFKQVEDVNHFNFVFPNGIQGIGATAYSWNANNWRAMGNRGILNGEPATGYQNNKITLNNQPIKVTPNNMWADQMDHFSECVRDPNKTLITPGEMGLRDIKLIEAILHSADTKSPVRFS